MEGSTANQNVAFKAAASASSSFNAKHHQPFNAVDGSFTGYWLSAPD
jgi:hypothetical protein